MAHQFMGLHSYGLYGDDVFTSTDLNRRSGEVLNRAQKRPVTISRNNELFALLPREQAASLFDMVKHLGTAVAVMAEANSAIAGGVPSAPFAWISVYDKDDIQKLLGEVLEATRKATIGLATWESLDTLIYEWRESAEIAKSGNLEAAMLESADEVPLDDPDAILNDQDAESQCAMKD